jgi:uncharacterized membrane protein
VPDGASPFGGIHELAPVGNRARWIAWGLLLQVVGVGIPVAAVVVRARKDSVLGHVTRYTVRLAWTEMLHNGSDMALIVLGTVVFVGGCIVMARPFVRRKSTLLLAVPVAATLGIVVLGVAVLVVAALIALALSPAGDSLDLAEFWPASRREKRRDDGRDR